MSKAQSARGHRPVHRGLDELRREAARCQACDLWRDATQTVFGKGAPHARVFLVGEQPGNSEDLAGEPFVGPAGRLLDTALAQAGLDPGAVYITNVVTHFKWTRRGKLRIHKKPNAQEIEACRPCWRPRSPQAARGAGRRLALAGHDAKSAGATITARLSALRRADPAPGNRLSSCW
jgi:uracil-DNA glycosylase family protein